MSAFSTNLPSLQPIWGICGLRLACRHDKSKEIVKVKASENQDSSYLLTYQDWLAGISPVVRPALETRFKARAYSDLMIE